MSIVTLLLIMLRRIDEQPPATMESGHSHMRGRHG